MATEAYNSITTMKPIVDWVSKLPNDADSMSADAARNFLDSSKANVAALKNAIESTKAFLKTLENGLSQTQKLQSKARVRANYSKLETAWNATKDLIGFVRENPKTSLVLAAAIYSLARPYLANQKAGNTASL